MNGENSRTKPGRARVTAAAAIATLALGVGACGGGDDSASTGAEATTDAAAGLTASEFILQLEDEKQNTIDSVIAANPECQGVEADRDFLLLVSAQATDLKPDEPIEPLIVDNCTP